MNRPVSSVRLVSRVVLVLLAAVLVESAPAAEQSSPAATNVPGAPTPGIHADRSITFTLTAPDARTVQVAGGDGLGAGPFPMTKDAAGTWSVTTPPAVPGTSSRLERRMSGKHGAEV